ncbi:MAG TPA: HAMP domain-containing sensor histidine kinase [Acidisarcina sp.]|nr:HAMP domain-containing sensor histidine kinase [Acidisarcina sp.]
MESLAQASFPIPGKTAPAAGPRVDSSAQERASLSHDMRNMLMALNLYCDLLSEDAVLPVRHRHYADELRLVVQAGSDLLDRLQHLATPPRNAPVAAQEAGSTAVGNLARELESCRGLLQALAGSSIRVNLEVGRYTGPVPLSREDLMRILVNLVRNASEAMRLATAQATPQEMTRGGGEIRIAVRMAEAVGPEVTQRVVLSVEDDGPGMDASVREHIFERGFTTKGCRGTSVSSTSASGRGPRGLGLAIVRELVEAAGGMVRASNRDGHGARFEITFPAVRGKLSTTKVVARKDTALRGGTEVQC